MFQKVKPLVTGKVKSLVQRWSVGFGPRLAAWQVEPRTWWSWWSGAHHWCLPTTKSGTGESSQPPFLVRGPACKVHCLLLLQSFVAANCWTKGQFCIRRVWNGLWEGECRWMMESLEKEYRLKIPEKWSKAWPGEVIVFKRSEANKHWTSNDGTSECCGADAPFQDFNSCLVRLNRYSQEDKISKDAAIILILTLANKCLKNATDIVLWLN